MPEWKETIANQWMVFFENYSLTIWQEDSEHVRAVSASLHFNMTFPERNLEAAKSTALQYFDEFVESKMRELLKLGNEISDFRKL